ncbi:MAG: patatin-like phospholipase family protein [Rhodobacteraceae bacterium]|nr:patatin-like phospholipase family protein [Paracoccaceae bacterium]
MKGTKIGLALSGGGSRAIAFHLGCLRALHELDILDNIKAISTVSGGSVIGGLYAVQNGSFPEFETQVRQLLEKGLVWSAVNKAFTTTEGLRALLCCFILFLINVVFFLHSLLARLNSIFCSHERRKSWKPKGCLYKFRRFASITTILLRMFDEKFGGIRLNQLPSDRPLLIILAANLRTGSAFYFSRKHSGSWRLGQLADNNISLGYAVTASAASPTFLPALDEELTFCQDDGSHRKERISLTDGGVYDNLGLTPLLPDREHEKIFDFPEIESIICCRAGYGSSYHPPSQFIITRLIRASLCIHERSQNVAINLLFNLKKAGELKGIVHPYLGQNDSKLRCSPTDLVTREDVDGYPTDFCAMHTNWIDKLSKRGEQLTKALIAEHHPELYE